MWSQINISNTKTLEVELDWYIFYTKGKNAKFEDKIENYEECIAAAQIMKDYVKEFPSIIEDSGQFYDSTNYGKHTFPHVIVDTNTGRLKPQNINKAWLIRNWKTHTLNNNSL